MQHILLVEDDPLMQRFVAYALEDEPFTLTCCETVPEAMAQLVQQSFDWILTDLMLPGISGLTFIQQLTARPELAGRAKIVALSAGIDPSVKQQLLSFGVVRQLLKPVSVARLYEVLLETPGAFDPPPAQAPSQSAAERYFGADHALFSTFTALSRAQFRQDIQDGDQWMSIQNFAAMHNLAHSLKSVLLLLGEERARTLATTLEQAASARAPRSEMTSAWGALRRHLHQLSHSAPQ